MKVVDDDGNDGRAGRVGEIVIRGHNVMKCYWDRAEATAEAINDDGWFHPATWRRSTRTATSSSSTARRT